MPSLIIIISIGLLWVNYIIPDFAEGASCQDGREEIDATPFQIDFTARHLEAKTPIFEFQLGKKRLQYAYESTQNLNSQILAKAAAHNACLGSKDDFSTFLTRWQNLKSLVDAIKSMSASPNSLTDNDKHTLESFYTTLIEIVFEDDAKPWVSTNHLVFSTGFAETFDIKNLGKKDLKCGMKFNKPFFSVSFTPNKLGEGEPGKVVVIYLPDERYAGQFQPTYVSYLECHSRLKPNLEFSVEVDHPRLRGILSKVAEVGNRGATAQEAKSFLAPAKISSSEDEIPISDSHALATFAYFQNTQGYTQGALNTYEKLAVQPDQGLANIADKEIFIQQWGILSQKYNSQVFMNWQPADKNLQLAALNTKEKIMENQTPVLNATLNDLNNMKSGNERPPQHVGFGTGVGDSQGVGDRSRVMDQDDMLRYLSAPETIMGEIVGIDYASGKLYIDMGGSSHDERQTLRGALNMKELWFDKKTNMQKLKSVGKGDYVTIQAENETTAEQKFGTGRKMVRDVYVLEGSQLLGGADNTDFGGGLGQRPNPYKYRGIDTRNFGYTGVPEGTVQKGVVDTGITSEIGTVTGAAPCWQCAPQPDTVNERIEKNIGTDYGDDRKNFNKGVVE